MKSPKKAPPRPPAPKPPENIEITDLARGGAGVGRTASGQVVFVPYACPGDTVRVQFDKVGAASREKTFLRGSILEIVNPSPQRVPPKCAIFGRCGGCDWQHLPYALQWSTKLKGLKEALRRAGIHEATLAEPLARLAEYPAANPYGYRNRIQLHGDALKRPPVLGFHPRLSNAVVDAERCEIARPEINTELGHVRQQIKSGVFHSEKPFKLELDFDVMQPNLGVRRFLNAPHAAGGFRQVNDAQNNRLREWVRDQVRDADLILDLYGGAGNLTDLVMGSLGEKKHPHVYCVDVSAPEAQSTQDRTFVRQPSRDWLLAAARAGEILKPQIPPAARHAIIDPPRTGVADDLESIAESLARQSISRLVAVGCETDSWARDLKGWIAAGWQIESFAAFDLFPQTPHVESAAVLVQRL